MIKAACNYNGDRTQNEWFLSKQKQNKIKIGIFTAMFRFPNHTHKLKAPDQPQNAGEESLLTRVLHSYLCNALCKIFIKIESNCFSKTYSEIESTWPIISHKEEIVLARDGKELFVQRFVKVFDQIWMHVEALNERTGTQLTLLYRGRTIRRSHRRCCIRKLFWNILQYPQETPVFGSIFKIDP